MLEAVTKEWEDKSTTEAFRFTFYCDCCKRAISSPEYKFKSGFRPKLLMSETERRARELLWQKDHDAAYERANISMLTDHIHTCEICGEHICGNCAISCNELEGRICCERCLTQKGYHGKKMWQGE